MSFAQYCGRGYGDYWRGIIFRRNYKHLDDIISKSKRWFNRWQQAPKFLAGSSSLKWVWPTGEELLLRAFEDSEDYWNYHGHEYPFIGWEELTSWASIDSYESMKSCNRSSFQPTATMPPIPRLIRSSTNPFGVGHCVPYGEVLTTRGWVDIKDVVVDDKVFSCTTTGEMVIKNVSAITHIDYSGDMISRKGTNGGLTMEFTPNHRLPHLNTSQTSHTVKPFNELPGDARIRRSINSWQGLQTETIHGFNAGDFMELLGWYISEGCMVNRADNSEKNSFQICQSKLPTWQRIMQLLTRMNLRFRCDNNSFTISNKILANVFREQGKCKTKHIPKEYANYSTKLLERLLESLMLGDGCRGMYYTLSKQLSDDVQELALKLGYCVYASQKMQTPYKDGSRKTSLNMSYAVSISKHGPTQLKTGNHVYGVSTSCNSVNVERKAFNGKVYCITVPDTETFFLRQNGCVWMSGNTWVKRYFIDPNPYGKITTDAEGNQRVAIFGSIKENPYLGPEYMKTLQSITDKNKRKAWLEGSWDITSGGMFDDLWDSTKHILRPFDIPSDWRIQRSFDWGSSKPFSCGWFATCTGSVAKMKDGTERHFHPKTMIRIGEWYGTTGKPNEGLRMPAKVVAQGIKSRERELRIENRVIPGPADSAIYAVTDEISIGTNMENEGVYFTPADKRPGSRKNGWELMRDRFNAVASDEEKPGMYVFDTCRDFIRTVPTIPRDPKDPDDVDCFVAGTLISCPQGQVPIEQLKIGDLVNTPIGPRRLLKAGVAGNGVPQQVMTIKLSDGQELCGTLDHKIYIENAGLRPLCRVLLGDTLTKEKHLSWLKCKSTMVSHIGAMLARPILFAVHLMPKKLELAYCIGLFGKPKEAKYQTGWISTTLTTTQEITSLETLNYKLRQTMQDTISKEDLLTVGISPSLLMRGEEAHKDKRYLERILKSAVKTLPSANLRALIVATLLQHNIHDKLFASQKNADLQQAGELKKKRNVLFAELQSLLNLTLTKKCKPVVTSVDGRYVEKRVYYLTVEQAHLFYANGVLSTNTDAEDHICDDSRYMVLSADHVIHRVKIGGH